MNPFARPMQTALAEARAAAARGETPVGAALYDAGGHLLARDGNRVRERRDPTAHAEMLAIRTACAAAGSERLPGARLWVTLEPCAMCAAAIAEARIGALVYAAPDPKGGGVEHGVRLFAQPGCRHRPEVTAGVAEAEAAALLRAFFRTLR